MQNLSRTYTFENHILSFKNNIIKTC